MNGVLLLNKPAGPTSHDMVNFVRRLSGTRRVGHAGTLDPFATGLLVLLIGQSTRISQFLINQDKTYVATVAFGAATDTLDRTGAVTETCDAPLPDRAELERVLAEFVGPSDQIPPMFSAKKVNGRPLYRAARRGEEVPRRAKTVQVHALDLLEIADRSFIVRVRCSKGTYVRVLADTIARRLGGCGRLDDLRRESSGRFQLQDAVTPDQAEELARQGTLAASLLPVESALLDLPHITLSRRAGEQLQSGMRPTSAALLDFDAFQRGQTLRLLDPEGRLVAMARALLDADQLRGQSSAVLPFELLRVFAPAAELK